MQTAKDFKIRITASHWQRLWSYDLTALYKSVIIIIILLLLLLLLLLLYYYLWLSLNGPVLPEVYSRLGQVIQKQSFENCWAGGFTNCMPSCRPIISLNVLDRHW